MSRYSNYPTWMLLTKTAILAIAFPVIVYMQICNVMSIHYREESRRYDDAALSISGGWLRGIDFNEASECKAYALLAAGSDAAHYRAFNAWWMIRNWNTDWLAKQKPCGGREGNR